MRRIRLLLLLAIAGILVAVAVSYYTQKNLQKSQEPTLPTALPPNTNAAAKDWRWVHTYGSRTVVEVQAGDFRQVDEPSRMELERVQLRIYDKTGKTFDEVKSAQAQFDQVKSVLYAEGEVEFTMGLPSEDRPPGRLVFIKSSGVTFDTKTGKCSSDRPAAFRFDQGDGKAVGASYDPSTRELHMHSHAEIIWRRADSQARPMKIEADEVVYRERDSRVVLSPWSRLTREDMRLDAATSLVTLEHGNIRRVETTAAHGTERNGDRQVEYAADGLTMYFSDGGVVERIVGERNAHLASVSGDTRTTVQTDRLELNFQTDSGESQLGGALATGHTVVDARPIDAGNARAADTRVLRSEVVELKMQPGGRDIQMVQTHTPGSVEFLPNQAGRRRRKMDAERLDITYGPENRIRNLTASKVSTRTESETSAGKKPLPPALTWSKSLSAEFDPKTGELTRMAQSDDFRYEQGERKGLAVLAILEPAADTITLQGSARLWDQEGSTSADRIVLGQKSGDVRAEGNAAATRAPGPTQNPSAMLPDDEPMQARARLITLTGNRQISRYEGDAVLWQGGNRIAADWVEIDRNHKELVAKGHVRTQFLDKSDPKQAGKSQSPVFSIVEAPSLFYDDDTRIARYQGGVTLIRPSLKVTSSELRTVMVAQNSGSGLEKAYADGGVLILHSAPGRTRKGTGEHAEYYAGEEKVILYGGQPQMEDSLKGSTRGSRLTWFPNNDRLLVDGETAQPSLSMIHRKK